MEGFTKTSSTQFIGKYLLKRKIEESGEYVNVYLVSERDVVPEDHHLLIQIVVDGVGAVGGDGDALPLGAPVLDPVEGHDGFALSGCW